MLFETVETSSKLQLVMLPKNLRVKDRWSCFLSRAGTTPWARSMNAPLMVKFPKQSQQRESTSSIPRQMVLLTLS